MKLRYTRRGAAELSEVLAFIAAESPQGSIHVSSRVKQTIDLILHFPLAGQLTTKGRLRRLSVTPYPYVVFYRVTESAVVIHGVRHASRKPSSMPS